jgi:Protein kinase domain/Sulfatase-modifying factor enzyme 1
VSHPDDKTKSPTDDGWDSLPEPDGGTGPSERVEPPREWPHTMSLTTPLSSPGDATDPPVTSPLTVSAPHSSSPPTLFPVETELSLGEGYQLLERIGQGQFGEVYRARAPGGVIVAVKRVFRSISDSSTQAELDALNRLRELRHPFLLQMHNFQAYQDRLIVVMELADGSLSDLFQESVSRGLPGIPPADLLRYFGQAAEAIDYLHDQKLQHRDIKPQNLLHLKGYAKVADFGVARVQEGVLDQTVNVRGTPLYMAPEMWRRNVSTQCDQYSLAVTWYQMRTGRFPVTGQDLIEIAQNHIGQEPDLSGVPESEQQVLRRALAKNPDDRFSTCRSFVVELSKVISGEVIPVSRMEPTVRPIAPAPTHGPTVGGGWKIALGALAFAVVAVLLAFYLSTRHGGHPPVEPLPSAATVSWQPAGWEPVDKEDVVSDFSRKVYYHRLRREVGYPPESVVMVVVPKKQPDDPATFYIMENKVWNDLFGMAMKSEQMREFLKNYSDPKRGLGPLVKGEWEKGGWAASSNPDPNKDPFLGVKGEFKGQQRGRFPVFRATVTEAHCFAQWMGGRLPGWAQWTKAIGCPTSGAEDRRTAPVSGDPGDPTDLVRPAEDGPWPVDWGKRDVSIYGCRQMATNGKEWTRDTVDPQVTIPLAEMLSAPQVYVIGESYTSKSQPLTFDALPVRRTQSCTKADPETSFRVVLEQ